MMRPSLPAELTTSEPMFDLDEVWYEVCKELTDPRFKNRTHHRPKTYTVGCRGPVCRKAIRESQRSKAAAQSNQYYAWLEPILMFFFQEAKSRLANDQRSILQRIL